MGFSPTSELVLETAGFAIACVELLSGIPRDVVTAVITSADGSAVGMLYIP